jgi:nucleotide-binding universal stress UspA family protein
MNDLDKHRARQESRRGGTDHLNRYGEAVNRYLGVAAYRTEETTRPAVIPSTIPSGLVVVGVDETPTSYTAVDHAAIEAELRGWHLRIVHVQRPGGLRPASRDNGGRLLERLTDRVHACSPSVPVDSTLLIGAAGQLLLAEARDATLVVVGHRHSSAGSAFGRSVGDRVAAQHAGPVLVVRVPGWPPGPGFGGRPIVVGAEEPGLDTPTVAFAMAEAKVRGCELIVLHAGPTAASTDRLETVDGVRVHQRTVGVAPAAALIDASSRAAAVVLGRRASAANQVAALLGSVSRIVLQRAYCPVFLVD